MRPSLDIYIMFTHEHILWVSPLQRGSLVSPREGRTRGGQRTRGGHTQRRVHGRRAHTEDKYGLTSFSYHLSVHANCLMKFLIEIWFDGM
jgi:hypothetical protein